MGPAPGEGGDGAGYPAGDARSAGTVRGVEGPGLLAGHCDLLHGGVQAVPGTRGLREVDLHRLHQPRLYRVGVPMAVPGNGQDDCVAGL